VNERGHAALELALAIALLMLPVALAVLAFGPWMERRVLAEAVAAEAARAVVLSLDHRAGVSIVEDMTRAHGLAHDLVRVGWCGGSPAPTDVGSGSCRLERGGVVEIAVQVWVPVVATPWGNIGGIWVTGEHAEPIDLYRSLP
jgi:hypothetical protein